MDNDTIHLCVVPDCVLYRASRERFIRVVYRHILLVVHSGSNCRLHIISLFAKMQQQA